MKVTNVYVGSEYDLDINVTLEFLAESIKEEYQKNKKGGPYNKIKRNKRQHEVAKLHFEYEYSARKISEMMKINRATVNSGIQFLFDEFNKKISLDSYKLVICQLMSLEAQKTKLRNILDETKSLPESLAIEKMLLDIDSKIINAYTKMGNTELRIHRQGVDYLNTHMEKKKNQERYISLFDTKTVSEKTQQRIDKIIKEDQMRI